MSSARLGVLEGWSEIIPPREMPRVEAMAREYEALAVEIDRRYEAGRTQGIEDLEERAERLLEGLSALYYHYQETEHVGEGVSVDEQLVWAWNNPQAFTDRAGWIANMRDAIETAALEDGKVIHPTDEEILAAAKDAAERKAALVRRYKPSMGAKARPQLMHLSHGQPLFNALADALDLPTAHDVYRKIVRRLREEPLAELGHGGWGVAYRLPSGRVLKVTSDLDEMDAAAALLGSPHRGLVAIHDVFVVDAGGGVAVGVIVRDWVEATLEEARPDLAAVIESAADAADEAHSMAVRAGRDRRAAARDGQAAFLDNLIGEAVDRGEPMLWDVVDGVERLRQIDLLGHGFHGRNVGLVNVASGEPRAVVFDFGRLVRKPRKFAMLGTTARYKVWVETPGGPMEESIHMIRSEADAYVKKALVEILVRAEFQLEVWRDHLQQPRFGDYYWGAQEAIRTATELLAKGRVSDAVGVWQEFEELDDAMVDGGEVGPPPLGDLVGRIKVEMDV